MIRKMLVIAAAVAMPVSVIAATAGPAAAVTKVNATNYTVTCTAIAATATFSPKLTNTATAASPEKTKIAGSVTKCTATPTTGGAAVKLSKGTVSGTITNASSTHTCAGLTTPTTETGSLKVTWTTIPAGTLLTATSTAFPTTVTGGAGGNGRATFTIAFSHVTGSFQGSDSGASSTSDAQTTTTAASIFTTCGKSTGLTSIKIQADTNSGHGNAIHLG